MLTKTSKSGITSPFTRHKANMQIDRQKVFQSKKISDTREPSPCVNAANFKFDNYVSGKGTGTITNYYVEGDILETTIGVASIGTAEFLPQKFYPNYNWYDSQAVKTKKWWDAGIANHDIDTVKIQLDIK